MPSCRVRGTHRVPGDKSISHRAIMLASLARGRSAIRGILTSLDAQSTASVLRALGSGVGPLRPGKDLTIDAPGELAAPATDLDCGNSGTTARLMLGILAGHRFEARLTGDSSLRARPMRRVTQPLRAMGAQIAEESAEALPLTIHGGQLSEIRWELPVASAQLKSALLLAAAVARVPVTIVEPGTSRDHTERMLAALGFDIRRSGLELRLEPTGVFCPVDIDVPGDPSSAAFLAGAALLASSGVVAVEHVGLNPTRTAAFDVMRDMGGRVTVELSHLESGEPVGTVTAAASALVGCNVPADIVPGLIDEIPMLACLASRAEGTTRFHDVGELRVKESDRLAMIVDNLRAIGAQAHVDGDDLIIEGTDRPFTGHVITGGDHRIAMAFAMLGTVSGNTIEIDDPSCAAVSFPGFESSLASLFEGRAT